MEILKDLKEALMIALNKARDAYFGLVKKGEVGIEKGIGAFGDITTEGDLTLEEVIIEVLRSRLVDVSFVTEERGIIGDIKTSKYIALIDPVDGSTNMKRGIRFFSAGIAVFEGIYYSDIIASGVIDIPSGQIFYADRTNLYIEDEGTSPSNVYKLENAVVSLDIRPLKRGKEMAENFLKLSQKIRYIRNLGSSLLEICQIATGKIDAFICLTPELRLFDLVPALFILERAGGCWIMDKSRFSLVDLTIKDRYAIVAASNSKLLEEIVSVASINWNKKIE